MSETIPEENIPENKSPPKKATVTLPEPSKRSSLRSGAVCGWYPSRWTPDIWVVLVTANRRINAGESSVVPSLGAIREGCTTGEDSWPSRFIHLEISRFPQVMHSCSDLQLP